MKQLNRSLASWQHQSETHFYIRPHLLLQKWIAHYTLTLPATDPVTAPEEELAGKLEIVPDASGCLVLTLENGGWDISVWGPTTKMVTVERDFNRIPARFFVEFMPGGLFQMVGIKPAELADCDVALSDVEPGLADRLRGLLEASGTVEEVFTRLDQYFLRQAGASNGTLLAFLLAEIQKREGVVTVQQLAELSGYSRRHLSRLASFDLGISLKQYIGVMRINRSVILLKNRQNEDLTQIGCRLGYFDQSHFIHDFRSVCGVSPGEYVKNLSHFYNEEFKF